MKDIAVPIWQKVTITIEEAAAYSNIGTARLRELTKLPDCNFVLMKGATTLIKRRKFEKYLEDLEVL